MGRLSILTQTLFAASVLGADWIGEVKEVEGVTWQCKCYSDNACWPTNSDWDTFNKTVGGALQASVPPGAPCYKTVGNGTVSVYDKAKCDETQAQWANEQWLTDHPIANLWPLYTNNTCLPGNDPSGQCTLGYYGPYVLLAKTVEHIQAGVSFARERNLRLVIRNTGHDFMGRSTGYGSLIINTHSFKSMKFVNKYTGPGNWTSSAATVGAGIQAMELFKEAYAQEPKVVIVGGECATVGWGGGYIQGGGHGPLTGLYGMGADNILSFDVVTAKGEFVTANAEKNSDLYWALKGGGPSSFGVVTSLTVKTHPEVPSVGTVLNINSTHTNDTALFAKAVKSFHNLSNRYANHGMFVLFELGPGPLRLHVASFVGPNMNLEQQKAVLKPLFDQLDEIKIPYDTWSEAFPTFFQLYTSPNGFFEVEPPNQHSIIGGRLFGQKDIAEHGDAIADALIMAAMPEPTQLGFDVGHIVNPGHMNPEVDNPTHPAWRNASSFVITNVIIEPNESWERKKEREKFNTNVVGKAFRELSPNGASYVNEGDLLEPDWQTAYWGTNYPRLLKIRQQYDPDGVFYTQTTPGTENWEVLDYGTKLCKKSS